MQRSAGTEAPTAIPKNVPSSSDNVAQTAPELGSVPGSVPGGVPGGVIGGVLSPGRASYSNQTTQNGEGGARHPQGQGFDPRTVPDPVAVENLEKDHGRGIHLMKLAMDEVSFEQRGAEVHRFKWPANDVKTT